MKANLPATEPATIARWDAMDLYGAIRDARGAGAPQFVLHDGPPYANGQIHIGHALNKILKDLVVKSRIDGRLRRAVRAGLGLPRPADRAQRRARARRRRPRIASPVEFRRACRAYADEVRRLAARGLQAARHPRRLGRSVPHDDAGLSGGHRAGARQVRRARPRLQGQEARPLVPARSHGARRSRSRVRDRTRRRRSTSSSRCRTPTHGTLAARVPALAGTRGLGADLDDDALDDPVEPGGRVSSGLRLRRVRRSTAAPSSSPTRSPRPSRRRTGRPLGANGRVVQGRARSRACAFRHPLYDRDSLGVLADYVTLEQGTGVVHTAPGHGADDFATGVRYGLDIYAPIGTRRPVPAPTSASSAGLKVFEANPVVEAALAERGRLWSPERRSSTRIRTAGAAISRSSSSRRRSGSSAWTACASAAVGERNARRMDPAVGPRAHDGHVRQPARLVHLAPARLGRADSGARLHGVRRVAR